jgi:uncharacterized protein (TIGR02145 family)
MTDSRDGQIYKTIKIGEQVWMAQNLNYKTTTSYCFNDSTEYCEKYGRLYTWAASVDKSEKECGLGNECNLASGNIRGICPDGWYLPSEADFETLIKAVGGEKGASTKLKSLSGWRDDGGESGNGTDSFGFSALPVGVGMQGFYGEGYGTQFWVSTECGSASAADKGYSCASIMSLDYDDVDVSLRSYAAKDFKFSIRCIKEDGEFVPVSSSSSVIPASSGNLPSSSSVTLATPCKTETEDNCEYGTLADSRDGQTYKTVKIGDQVWMAENLNYENGNSMCYSDDSTKCGKSGRIYTWDAAKEVCPSGWHLPDTTEWVALFSAVGTRGMAGRNLKSTTGWADNGNGVDAYGFSVLPIAFWDDPDFIARDEYALFWSSTEVDADKAELQHFYMSYDSVIHGSFSKKMAVSVRCLKD